MIEAKKRELNQQLAELEDDGTGSEQSFEGLFDSQNEPCKLHF